MTDSRRHTVVAPTGSQPYRRLPIGVAAGGEYWILGQQHIMPEFFAPLLQPLGFGWTLVVLYALWQLLRRRLSRALAALLVAATVFAIGSTPWPARLLATLERPYVADNFTNLPPADVVVMLGGVLERSHHDVFVLNSKRPPPGSSPRSRQST